MQNLDLNKPNIFIKFQFEENKDTIFLYSNSAGLENLNQALINSPFSNLLTCEEVLIKMSYEIAFDFSSNSLTGIKSKGWAKKKIFISQDEEIKFQDRFDIWYKQLVTFLGKDNIFIVPIKNIELDEKTKSIENTIDPYEHLLEFIESCRLQDKLNSNLNENLKVFKKIKL